MVGNGFSGDIAIDDITVAPGACAAPGRIADIVYFSKIIVYCKSTLSFACFIGEAISVIILYKN